MDRALEELLREADEDEANGADMSGDDAGGADDADNSTDDNNDGGNEEDNASEDDNNDNADEESGDEEEEPGDDDFDVDTGEMGDDPEDEEGGDDSGSDDSSSSDDDGPEVDPDSLKAKDKELFDTLDPQEQKLKNKKLKEMFLELYSNCNNIIDKFNSISIEADDMLVQVKKILAVLFNLKLMISDYLANLYDSKSYIENDIMLNRYLSVFNSVKNITKEIRNVYKDDIELDK